MEKSKGNDAIDPRQSGALHRPPGIIDAGKEPDGNDGAIDKPSTNMDEALPGPGNEATGQVSKM
jgi:hypothetical protein